MTPRERAAELLAGLKACLAEGPRAGRSLKSLGEAAGRVPVQLLVTVDGVLRESFSTYQSDGWPHLGPSQLVPFMHVPDAWAIMAVASSHLSGSRLADGSRASSARCAMRTRQDHRQRRQSAIGLASGYSIVR